MSKPSDETDLERELLQAAQDADILARMVAAMGHAADVVGLTGRAATLCARALHVRVVGAEFTEVRRWPYDYGYQGAFSRLTGPLPAPAEAATTVHADGVITALGQEAQPHVCTNTIHVPVALPGVDPWEALREIARLTSNPHPGIMEYMPCQTCEANTIAERALASRGATPPVRETPTPGVRTALGETGFNG
jgi:hypothetical protein